MADRASRAISVLQRAGFRGERLKAAFDVVVRESGLPGSLPGETPPAARPPQRAPGASYALGLMNLSRARRGADPLALPAPPVPLEAADAPLRDVTVPPARAAVMARPTRKLAGLPPVKGALQLPLSFRGTHITDGLDWSRGKKTAVDIMARAGTPVLSPVAGTVIRWGSAQGGEALYLDDDDPDKEPDFWLGHVEDRAPVGTRVRRGQKIARISGNHPRPHAHLDRKR